MVLFWVVPPAIPPSAPHEAPPSLVLLSKAHLHIQQWVALALSLLLVLLALLVLRLKLQIWMQAWVGVQAPMSVLLQLLQRLLMLQLQLLSPCEQTYGDYVEWIAVKGFAGLPYLLMKLAAVRTQRNNLLPVSPAFR